MEKKKAKARSICPACKGIIELEHRQKRQDLIDCPHCGQILEVVSEFPQRLDFPDDPNIPALGKQHRRRG